ncbi:septum formation family protein [Arthrobacter sp. JZ12]|uniref:septum formation family protein n=1 Tax=Arthrobacter sp. JZ12 TaxID=2654190 RepID=UPI002B488507|nr:septum formation family protein [Arthrobacter sp. JZ12]
MKSAALVVLLSGMAMGVSGCYVLDTSVVERDEAGQVTEATEFHASSISVGDCANYPDERQNADAEEGYNFSEITVLPCSEKHDMEAYAATDLPDGEFPGETELWVQADEFCFDEFADFVGAPYEESSLYYEIFTSTKAAWGFDGDREILCLLAGQEGELLTGSMKDTGR